jgi:hypothetical protein
MASMLRTLGVVIVQVVLAIVLLVIVFWIARWTMVTTWWRYKQNQMNTVLW